MVTPNDVRDERSEFVIKRGEALERLEKNKDFNLVFLDGYCGKYKDYLVEMLAEPDVINRNERARFMEQLVSISNFIKHMWAVKQEAANVKFEERMAEEKEEEEESK